MKNFSKKQKIIIIIILIIISVIYYIYKTNEENNMQENINEILETEGKTKQEEKESEKSQNEVTENNESKENTIIMVHIAGAIKKEGVYELKEGDRIIDAINMAEGVTEEADTSQINMAYKLEDGMKIYIPKKGENVENIEIMQNTKTNQNNELIQNSGKETNSKTNSSNSINSKKININTASIEELDTLPGIGEATAQKIIDYRKENYDISSLEKDILNLKIEDLKEVSGIGDSKFEKIKDRICV